MLTDTTPSPPRSAAPGGERRRRAAKLGSVAVLVIGLVATGFGSVVPVEAAAPVQAAAQVAGSPAAPSSNAAAPTAPPTADPPTIAVENSASAHTRASGTAAPNVRLRVLDPQHPASSLCAVTATADGSWSCVVVVASGADQTLRVRDLTDTTLPDVQSGPFSVLTAPVVSNGPGLALGARVQGTGFPGATVIVSLRGAGAAPTREVSATVGSSGTWQILLSSGQFPSGTYTVSATQRSTSVPAVPVSSTSAPVSLTIDRTAPAAPGLSNPAAGSTVTTQPLTFDGTGEPGATVTTYVDSNPVCTAVVSETGRWQCTSAGLLLPAGTRNVQAAQRDPAGNYGAPSTPRSVVFAAVQPQTTPSPTSPQPAPSGSAQPGTPTSPGQVPAPTGTPAPQVGGGAGGSGSGSSGGGTTGLGAGDRTDAGSLAAASWTGSTGFGRTLPSLSQGLGGWSWPWALALGLIFILLVVAPLRLAASALGGRLAHRARRFTGRNRAHSAADDSPLFSPATAVTLTLVAGALTVALASGVDDQVRYVRLVVAIAIGLAVLNGLAVVLPTWITGRRFGLRTVLRVSPRMLAVAVVACLATRVFDLDPPIVLGVLVAATLVDGDGSTLDETGDKRRGGIVATVQLASVTVVSFAAWVVHGAVPLDSTDFVVEMTREALATVCLAGFGSLIVLLIPLGRLPGRALYSWSRPTLAALAVVGVASAAVVFAGNPAESFPIVPLVIAAVVFAVLALSAWVWVRFVEPATVDDDA